MTLTKPDFPSRIDIELIRATELPEPASRGGENDDLAQVEDARLAGELWREQHRREKEAADLKGHKNDIENRAKYTRRLFILLCVWMGVVLGVIVASGITPLAFKLSDAVLIALITGTTANVIGLFVIVARYLFTKK